MAKYIERAGFTEDLRRIMTAFIGKDYANQFIDDENFVLTIKRDVEESSDWEGGNHYNDDDIHLAIGRLLTKHKEVLDNILKP